MYSIYTDYYSHDDRNLLKKMCGIMKESKLPERHKTDFKHDVNTLRGERVKEGTELLWMVEENGTHLFDSPVSEGFTRMIIERYFANRNFLLFHIKVTMKLYWSKKVWGEIKPVANIIQFTKYIDYRKEEERSLKSISEECVEKAVECQIPTFLNLIEPVKKGLLTVFNLPKLKFLYEHEVRQLNGTLRRAKSPSLYMSKFYKSGNDWICDFSGSDLDKPLKDECNWHGQNTSRWCYAGCILINNKGEVSSHH